MTIYRARVVNGRLTLDEPTDLPEGTLVELVPVDPYVHLDDVEGLDDEERERLRTSLRRGLEQMRAGELHDLDEVWRGMGEPD